jgi:hypothetical protein
MEFRAPGSAFPTPEELFRAPRGDPPPSTIIRTEEDQDVFIYDVADRLKWSLLDPPSVIEVLDLNETGSPQWSHLLIDPKHAFANEAITKPQRSRMLVVIDIVESWEYWQDADAWDERPAPLVIENTDGQPITVEQFVTEVYAYATELRDLMFEAEGRNEAERLRARYYYLLTSGPGRKDAGDTEAVFYISTKSDVVNSDAELADWWSQLERRYMKEYVELRA